MMSGGLTRALCYDKPLWALSVVAIETACSSDAQTPREPWAS
jgi:hypothetical protein